MVLLFRKKPFEVAWNLTRPGGCGAARLRPLSEMQQSYGASPPVPLPVFHKE